ncbi:hypothetical protein [Microbispora sp. ATCC PTA-5024]|uniref:hypothetical protein n=1 Tax=Microbispora sp. ATCC PTA-5024 TaxID=316330 RepID=UPI0003DDDDA4|nr:hypothetical protein [Microbispora sp. ATCC PTA-5024]ETK30744.1 hypothetical protein MPTA5024_38590 [Microbispora sp. ATCC PTA-5024]
MSGSTIRTAVLAATVLAALVAAGVRQSTAAPSREPAGGAGRFSACMRSHGLPGFPDVAVSSDGLVNLDIKGERVDALSATYGAAVTACGPLLPTGSRLPGAPEAPSAPALPS